jgi:ubiquinone/menaquinone biosynthesis C-methylase UbiE
VSPNRRLLASGYSLLNRLNLRRIEECATLIRWLEAAPGERILDVGCGDGSNAVTIARVGASVVGIDVNSERLALATAGKRSSLVEFRRMDAADLAFEDESFDRVVSFCGIEHFPNDEQVLAELHRVLRPGGILALSADSLSNPEVTESERAAHRTRYAAYTLYTPEIVRDKLSRAGFELERTRYILTTPLTLRLVRLSWRLDDLPPVLLPVKIVGYVLLRVLGKPISDLAERVARRRDTGLTLLARAHKRPGVLQGGGPGGREA